MHPLLGFCFTCFLVFWFFFVSSCVKVQSAQTLSLQWLARKKARCGEHILFQVVYVRNQECQTTDKVKCSLVPFPALPSLELT